MSRFYLIILVLELALTDCQKPFLPKTEHMPAVLVVEGYLSTQSTLQSVTLTYSSPFGERPGYSAESDATVYITDDRGSRFDYYETERAGIYRSRVEDDVKGSIGHTYILHIITNDSVVYESTPQTIRPCPEPSDLACRSGEEKILTEDAYGAPLVITYNGIKIITSSIGILNSGNFYQYVWYGYEEHYTRVHENDTVNYDLYEHRRLSSLYISNIRTGSADGIAGHEIINKKLAFIPYSYLIDFTPSYQYLDTFTIDSTHFHDLPKIYVPSTDSIFYTYFKGLLLKMEQRSLTPDAYEFWNAAENQLSAKGNLFDPATSQINGNIYCVSDPGKNAYGIFTAYDTKNKFAYMYYDGKHSFSREIDSFPELVVDTFKVDTVPGGWIDPPF